MNKKGFFTRENRRVCRRHNAALSWLLRGVLALVAGFALPPLTHAQETNWPSKTVTVVVGFGAGGATDVMARMASRTLSEDLKQPFVVENRVGGAGNVAATYVARSAPDGHTLSPQIAATPKIQAVSRPRQSPNSSTLRRHATLFTARPGLAQSPIS